MKKIVFPTDFSAESAKAVPVAAQLARLFDADLHLIHVLSPVMPGFTIPLHSTGEQHRQAETLIDQAFGELQAMPCLTGVRVQTHLLTGTDPGDLLDDDRFADADLLMMASAGATGLEGALMRSNAEHLIQRAKLPVLVLKNPSGQLDLKTVVFASDFHDHYDESIDFLRSLLGGFEHPILHLLFVNTLSRFVPTHEIRPRMEAFAVRYELSGCTLNQQDELDVETGLLAFAQANKADLIVLGTHGRRGLRHLLQGSIAEDVANHSPIPVLTLPLQAEHIPMVLLEGVTPTLI
ncbi:MAG: universal stress protein [Bacteroidetes bacterium]|nr:universal stress protein [Fibrella sp.]